MVPDLSIEELIAFKDGMSYISGMTFIDRKNFDRYVLENALSDLRKQVGNRQSARRYLPFMQLYIPGFSDADFNGAAHGLFDEEDNKCYIDRRYIETSSLNDLKKTCLHEEAHRLAHVLDLDSYKVAHSEKWAGILLDLGGDIPCYYTKCTVCGEENVVDSPIFYSGKCGCGNGISEECVFMINAEKLIAAGQRKALASIIRDSIANSKRLIIVRNQKIYVNFSLGSEFKESI